MVEVKKELSAEIEEKVKRIEKLQETNTTLESAAESHLAKIQSLEERLGQGQATIETLT